jgi:pimeloyl-ACP methyl ester carboxylesterase
MNEKDLAQGDFSTIVRLSDVKKHLSDAYKSGVSLYINTLSKLSTKFAGRAALKVWGKTRFKKSIPRGVFSFVKPEYIEIEKKKIAVYKFGDGDKKILLTHGWEGQASDFFKMIPVLVESGYQVITFDGPAHGLSMGTHSHLFEFVEVIESLSKHFSGFDIAIGHSMGGAATVVANYLSVNFNPQIIIPIAAPNKLETIIETFANFVNLDKIVFHSIVNEIEKTTGLKVKDVSLENYLKDLDSKIMLIHDEDDNMVPYRRVEEIIMKVKVDKVVKTQNLGHFRILRDPNVIQEVLEFIKKENS